MFGIGHASAGITPPERVHERIVEHRVEVPVTVTQERVVPQRVEVPVTVNSTQTVISYHLPKSCDSITPLLDSNDALSLKISMEVGGYPEILSNAVANMADKDYKALNQQIETSRGLIDTLGTDQIALQESHSRLASALKKCRQEIDK